MWTDCIVQCMADEGFLNLDTTVVVEMDVVTCLLLLGLGA